MAARLYIDTLILKNFKSFKRERIRFTSGFNCIVGPNGSGKSSIIEAIAFALSDLSFKKYRISNAAELINNSSGKNESMEITLKLSGEADIEITKKVDRDNKISYKLNGKKATRNQIVELLDSYSAKIEDINLMLQGEIQKIIDANQKERRELIEMAAGIKEFDDKKRRALDELEQVNVKINAAKMLLEERLKNLKEVEAERDTAIRYNQISKQIKNIRATLLSIRRDKIINEIESIDKEIESINKRYNDANDALSLKSNKLNEIREEIDSLNREIKSRVDMNSPVYAELESFKKERESIMVKITERESRLESLNKEIKDLEIKNSSLESRANELNDIVRKLEEEIKQYNRSDNSDDLMKQLISERDSISRELNQIDLNISSLKEERYKLEAEFNLLNKQNDKDPDLMLNRINELKNTLKSNREKISKMKIEIDSIDKELRELKINRSKLEEEQLRLKEELIRYSNKSLEELESRFREMLGEGYYGVVAELVKADSLYEKAFYAALGNRINYFVVDSIETAERAINIIKRMKLQRATFIPLKDVKADDRFDSLLDALINHVSYDPRLRKLAVFLLSNTYVVREISEAKQYGLGRRYVSLDGDIVEPNALVTGGELKQQSSPKLIESKLDEINSMLSDIDNRYTEKEELKMRLEKEIAKIEIIDESLSKELFSLNDDYNNLLANLNSSSKRKDEITKRLDEIDKRLSELTNKRELLSNKMNEIDKRLSELTNRMLDDKSKAEELNKKVAELSSSKKELQMLEDSIKNIDNELSNKRNELDALERSIKEMKARAAELDDKIKEHESRYNQLISSTKQLYSRLDELTRLEVDLDNTIKQLGNTITELRYRLSSLNDKRAQLESSKIDVEAELKSFNDFEIVNGDEQQLTEMLKQLNNELNSFTNVNFKAIEVYDQKRSEYEEMNSILEKLVAERDSIIDMINKIEYKKREIFFDTLERIKENFSILYSKISDKKVEFTLTDKDKPFESGLIIELYDNKRKHSLHVLSGGERSLIMITLLLAIQMMKPKGFYLFDEIDAALDKENSKKLSKIIKSLSDRSQFIVISHNDSTIVNADSIIGVIKTEDSSKVVEKRVEEIIKSKATKIDSNEKP
ncbi:MAG: chromosome segregation protein SMC [Candidatus Micrarchaeota archaeon]|nr:MAG: chromosome segregation protein SMC [Candidatus Micrarchaeota archaeon]